MEEKEKKEMMFQSGFDITNKTKKTIVVTNTIPSAKQPQTTKIGHGETVFFFGQPEKTSITIELEK